MKTKHIPVRTCVACRSTDEKRDLMRIVRQPDGNVCHDARGKISGRGAYLCAKTECIALAKKRKQLERALKVSALSDSLFEELTSFAAAVIDTPPKA
ncbi:MAG: YlxR family protein [Armatimonadetes bacterium]|nr:YlxR family protein [Armatimonadota bacterium]